MKTKSIIVAAMLSLFALSSFAAPHHVKHKKHHSKKVVVIKR